MDTTIGCLLTLQGHQSGVLANHLMGGKPACRQQDQDTNQDNGKYPPSPQAATLSAFSCGLAIADCLPGCTSGGFFFWRRLFTAYRRRGSAWQGHLTGLRS